MKKRFLTLALVGCFGLITAGIANANTLPEIYQPAALAIEAGNYGGAITALSKMPSDNDREALIAFAYKQKGDAIRTFIYSKRISNMDEAGYDLSSFYIDRADTNPSAKTTLLKLGQAVSGSDNGDGMAWLGDLYKAKSQWDGALRLYLTGHEMYPKNARLAQGAGEVYISKEDFEQAVKYFTRAHLLEPQKPVHMINLGKAYYMGKRPEKAVELWDKALILDPGNTELYKDIQRVKLEILGAPTGSVTLDGGKAAGASAGKDDRLQQDGKSGAQTGESQDSATGLQPAQTGGATSVNAPAPAVAAPAGSVQPAGVQTPAPAATGEPKAQAAGSNVLNQALNFLRNWLSS